MSEILACIDRAALTSREMSQVRARRFASFVLWPAIPLLALAGLLLTFADWWQVSAYGSTVTTGSAWTEFGPANVAVVLAALSVAALCVAKIRDRSSRSIPVWPLRAAIGSLVLAAVLLWAELFSPPEPAALEVEAFFNQGGVAATTTADLAATCYLLAGLASLLLLSSRGWISDKSP